MYQPYFVKIKICEKTLERYAPSMIAKQLLSKRRIKKGSHIGEKQRIKEQYTKCVNEDEITAA
jgi:hypothetical protein